MKEVSGRGTFGFKARGKLFAWPAVHKSAEPNTLAVRIDLDQRADLIAAEPDVYYVTDHYTNYPTVLVRLDRIDRTSLRDLLAMAWRLATTPKKTTRARLA